MGWPVDALAFGDAGGYEVPLFAELYVGGGAECAGEGDTVVGFGAAFGE